MRTALGGAFTVDELAIMADASSVSWLYDGQLPLYAWSQGAVIALFGPTVLSATLLKNAILLLICLTIFALVKHVSNTSYALAASISLLFLPQIAWTSQHGMTAPVLATLFAASTLLSFSRLAHEPTLPRYGLLGAMIGLGALSAPYYLFVPAALIPAALTSSRHRSVILDKRMAITAVIATCLAAKPYHGLYLSGAIALPDLSGLYPLSMDLILKRAGGMVAALQTVLIFASLLIMGAGIAIYSGLGRNLAVNDETRALRDLLLRTVSMGLLLILGVAFLGGDVRFDQASLQPLLFIMGPLLALYLYPVMSAAMHKRAVKVAGLIAAVILLVTPAHYSFGGRLGLSDQQAAYQPEP